MAVITQLYYLVFIIINYMFRSLLLWPSSGW